MTRTDHHTAEFDPEPSSVGLLLVVERFANGLTFARVYTRDNHATCLAHIRLDPPSYTRVRTTCWGQPAWIHGHQCDNLTWGNADGTPPTHCGHCETDVPADHWDAVYRTTKPTQKPEPAEVDTQATPEPQTTTQASTACLGICLTGSDIGIPSAAIAYAHPDCPAHNTDPSENITPKNEKQQVSEVIGSPARANNGLRVEVQGKPQHSEFVGGLAQAVSFEIGDPGNGPNLTVMFPLALGEAVLVMAGTARIHAPLVNQLRARLDEAGTELDRLRKIIEESCPGALWTDPVNTVERPEDAARRFADELWRLATGLADRGIPLVDGPVDKAPVTTVLAELDRLRTRRDDLMQQRDACRRDLNSLGVVADTLKTERDTAVAEADRRRAQRDEARTKLKAAHARLAEVTSERDDALRNPLNTAANLARAQLAEAAGQLAQARTERDHARKDSHRADAATVSVRKLLAEETATLRRTRIDLDRQHQHLVDARTDRDAARDQLAATTRQRDSLARRCGLRFQEIELLRAQVNNAHDELVRISFNGMYTAGERARFQAELAEVTRQRDEAARNATILLTDNGRLAAENARLRQHVTLPTKPSVDMATDAARYSIAPWPPLPIPPGIREMVAWLDKQPCRPDETGLCHHPNHEH